MKAKALDLMPEFILWLVFVKERNPEGIRSQREFDELFREFLDYGNSLQAKEGES